MKRPGLMQFAGLFFGVAALAGPVVADVTYTVLFDGGYPLSISADGQAIAGNNVSDYGAFRWTSATGRVELGRAALPVLGRTGGYALISADGTKVAGTIHSDDSTFVTAGLWTMGQGWQQLLPPGPPDAALIDDNLADVWGLSGDGNTVVGLYWRQVQFATANAMRWTPTTGAVSLGSSGRSSRANGASFNGSVIAGWDEHPVQGFRRASAWADGQLTVLGDPNMPGEAREVSSMGNVVVGYQLDPVTNVRSAARWTRNGGSWSNTQILGYVPGTEPSFGINVCTGVSGDGNTIVGYCSYEGDPFSTTGFVWTPATGMVEVNQFLADNGILPDPAFTITTLQVVSADGSCLVGYGRDVTPPYTVRAFMIRLESTVDVARDFSGIRGRLLAVPNPITAATTLQFELPSAASGALSIFDSSGRLVRRLLDGALPAGPNRVHWDGRDAGGSRVGAGVYYTRLETGTSRTSGKLIVLQ